MQPIAEETANCKPIVQSALHSIERQITSCGRFYRISPRSHRSKGNEPFSRSAETQAQLPSHGFEIDSDIGDSEVVSGTS